MDRGTELEATIERAVTTITELVSERRRLQREVAALHERLSTLEQARRQDHSKLERLELFEQERDAVRQRLGSLLERLEAYGSAE